MSASDTSTSRLMISAVSTATAASRYSGEEKSCGLFSWKRRSAASAGAGGSGAAAMGSDTTVAARCWSRQRRSRRASTEGAAAPARTAVETCCRARSARTRARNCASVRPFDAQEGFEHGAREAAAGRAAEAGDGEDELPHHRVRHRDAEPRRLLAQHAVEHELVHRLLRQRRGARAGRSRSASRRVRDRRCNSRRSAACASSISIGWPLTRASAVSRPRFRTMSPMPQMPKDRTSSTKSALATQVEARRRRAVSMVVRAGGRRSAPSLAEGASVAKPPRRDYRRASSTARRAKTEGRNRP